MVSATSRANGSATGPRYVYYQWVLGFDPEVGLRNLYEVSSLCNRDGVLVDEGAATFDPFDAAPGAVVLANVLADPDGSKAGVLMKTQTGYILGKHA